MYYFRIADSDNENCFSEKETAQPRFFSTKKEAYDFWAGLVNSLFPEPVAMTEETDPLDREMTYEEMREVLDGVEHMDLSELNESVFSSVFINKKYFELVFQPEK